MGIDAAEASRRGQRRSHKAEYFVPNTKAGAAVKTSIADILLRLSEDVQSKVIRSAAYAGARLIYEELQTRVPHGTTGNLAGAVYHKYLDGKSKNGVHAYAIGVNTRKAPHWFLVEYGHFTYFQSYLSSKDGKWHTDKTRKLDTPKWVPPNPYLRPTFEATASQAIRAVQQRMVDRLREVTSVSAS